MGLWAALLSSAASFLPAFPAYLKKVSVRSGLLGSFGSPIALLLTLRTNRALERLLDARKTWGVMSSQVQSLAGYFCSYVAPADLPLALLALRYLAILSWTLKGFLRREIDDEIIQTVLPPEEAAWLLAAPADRPTAVLSRLRKLCMMASVQSLNEGAHLQMADRVNELEQCIGICKRLVGSPIPPTFTRHTARLLCLYLTLLPIGLLGVGMSPVGVVIATSLTTYILVGVDEIGHEIEYPFPLLPMQELSKIMHNNVMKQAKMMRDMP
jgi:predicted membrane chloride channel (bestrophin family)